MSYTELHYVPRQGELYGVKEYRNSHRSASLWWQTLANHYRPAMDGAEKIKLHDFGFDYTKAFWGGADDGMRPVWMLAGCQEVEPHHRLVMALTFDHVILEYQRLERAARALEQFVKDFGTINTGHAEEIARDLVAVPAGKDLVGVCFTWTSVADDVWRYFPPNEDDECRWYDVSKGSGHYWLFESMGGEKMLWGASAD